MSIFSLFSNSPKGIREAMIISYEKHLKKAIRGEIETKNSPHETAMFGSLGTRNKVVGLPTNEAYIWIELSPFLELNDYSIALKMLSLYAAWREIPDKIKTEEKEILQQSIKKGIEKLVEKKSPYVDIFSLPNFAISWSSLIKTDIAQEIYKESKNENGEKNVIEKKVETDQVKAGFVKQIRYKLENDYDKDLFELVKMCYEKHIQIVDNILGNISALKVVQNIEIIKRDLFSIIDGYFSSLLFSNKIINEYDPYVFYGCYNDYCILKKHTENISDSEIYQEYYETILNGGLSTDIGSKLLCILLEHSKNLDIKQTHKENVLKYLVAVPTILKSLYS
ncbi:hypothetical protein [Marispirochaeta aestuarii]|uniref:hypothetical protein n=1 Tax=Marispirochaeta aestuarii TaxID=1963862 RepID=UPI0029C6F04F|nr:hypothetical protein [Marispirochaeta aestuarii]